MCGRYTLRTPADVLTQALGLESAVPELTPRYNIAPTQEAPAVRLVEDGRRLDMLRWGLIPGWAKEPEIGSRMINARLESVAEKPAFRAAFRRRRCLVPADGFYEWHATVEGRQPVHFRRPADAPFTFAGLWERWSKGPAPVESFTILTTEAAEPVAAIHTRMPVIVPPEGYAAWLDPEVDEPEVLLELLRAGPSTPLEGVAVSRHVNSPRHDDPDCLQPG